MASFILHFLISAAVLLFAARMVEGLKVEGYRHALLGAAILGLINAIIRPVMILLTLPLTIITFGLFLFVINALVLMLVAAITPGFSVRSFGSALIASVVISVCNLLVSLLIGL